MDTSYLAQQVTTIIGQLHGIFDEIGVPSHERDSREAELFSALSETLHNQLRLVTSEKKDLTEEAHRLIKTIRQMETSLDDVKPNNGYDAHDDDLEVTYPLIRCLQTLKEKYNTVSKIHRERFEQVKKLVQALESYASHLEPSFVQIKLPPTNPNAALPPTFDLSPSYVTSLDNEFTRVYDEYNRRVAIIKGLAEEIVHLWAELGIPQAQTDSTIVELAHEAPEQLGLHKDDLARLKAKRDKLLDEKRGRERRLKELQTTILSLWDRLGIEEADRRAFLAANRGCGMRVINQFEDELARLNELKRQNLHLFVEEARCRLQELWDVLYFSEDEMLEFTPAFSDVYSDALLAAHEREIQQLEALKEQRLPTLQLIEKHRSIIKDRDDLAASSQDASRLMARGQKGEKRDPTRLLREEKMRKRIAKELPKVESDLRNVLEDWEEEYGRPFLVHGQRYLDELNASQAATKAPPPRSKTPAPSDSRAAPTLKTQKSVPASLRGGSVRGAPPPRSKTPTATLGRNNNFSSSIMSSSVMSSSIMSSAVSNSSTIRSGATSPSKIPARVPLHNMPNGNNSPERRLRPGPPTRTETNDSVVRKMGPPARPPPPKMKDLFVPPTPQSIPEDPSSIFRSGSIVRQVPPEDVYQDRAPSALGYHRSGSVMDNNRPGSVMDRPGSVLRHHYPQAPSYGGSSASSIRSGHSYASSFAPEPVQAGMGSRQISGSSSAAGTQISGSENWETYDDASEAEDDEYYARLKAAQGKRDKPAGGYGTLGAVAGKKIRGPAVGDEVVQYQDERRVASWETEDAF